MRAFYVLELNKITKNLHFSTFCLHFYWFDICCEVTHPNKRRVIRSGSHRAWQSFHSNANYCDYSYCAH